MKKLSLIIAMILMASVCFGANTQISGVNYEEASIDTDPGTDGYWCVPVSAKYQGGAYTTEIWFYIKTIGTSATVSLQWSSDNVTFYDVQDGEYTEIGRYVIRDYAKGVYYRVGVKDDDQGSSGASLVGIHYK